MHLGSFHFMHAMGYCGHLTPGVEIEKLDFGPTRLRRWTSHPGEIRRAAPRMNECWPRLVRLRDWWTCGLCQWPLAWIGRRSSWIAGVVRLAISPGCDSGNRSKTVCDCAQTSPRHKVHPCNTRPPSRNHCCSDPPTLACPGLRAPL